MPVKFEWVGGGDAGNGQATYTIETPYEMSSYVLNLPSFEEAHQIDQALRDAYAQGRRTGHTEMMRATSDAMNEVARKKP